MKCAGEGGDGVEPASEIVGVVEEVGGEGGAGVGVGVLFAGGSVEIWRAAASVKI